MKSMRKFPLTKAFFLAVAAMAVSVAAAQAQTATGKFTLAHKVRWAGAVLPPGEYAFSLDSQNPPSRVTVRQVDGSMVAILLPQVISDDNLAGSSSLVLRDEGGESVVKALRLTAIGVALHFSSPKTATPVAEATGLGPIAQSQPVK
jgi:hypothetical protein